jgi:hypothetical protein
VVDILVSEKWGPGLSSILKHPATVPIFKSAAISQQMEVVDSWFTLRKAQPNEFHKFFDDPLAHAPYSLNAIYVLLANT